MQRALKIIKDEPGMGPAGRQFAERSDFPAAPLSAIHPYASLHPPDSKEVIVLQQADALALLKQKFPGTRFEIIFDVGANVGQSSANFQNIFSNATIIAIEPSPAAFSQLNANFPESRAFRAFQIALSSSSGLKVFITEGSSTSHKLMPDDVSDLDHDPAALEQQLVRTERGEDFCAENKIEFIDYLKIDTEGHDLEILKGFSKLLIRQKVSFIDVEVGMNRSHRKFVHIAEMFSFLDPLSYHPFHIYEQAFERNGKAYLRRANVIFVSQAAVQQNIYNSIGPSVR